MAALPLAGNRTTTWDRPPLALPGSLSRTATLLESARVTPNAAVPLTGARADSSGVTPAQPASTQVPPTTLRELRPLAAPGAPLLRLGTWSEAPQAQLVPAWKHPEAGQVMQDPKLGDLPMLRVGPVPMTVALPRAATVTGPSPALRPTGPVQLQRAGTLNLGTQQPATGISLHRAQSITLQASPIPVIQRVVSNQPGAPVALVRQVQMPVKPVLPAKPLATQEHVPEIGRLLLQSAFAVKKKEPKQLRMVIGGLMGSGKSTICRMLRHLFQGCWINQDEFSHLGKGAKKAFLAAIEKAAADDTIPVLLVDKINTMKQHREEIVHAMNRGKPGHTVFIQVKHPADGQGWSQTLRLCESRIAQRGEGHRTLKASPQLRGILQRTVNGAEPLGKDELANFCGTLTVDMTQSSIIQVMRLISDLDELDVLGDIDIDHLLSEGQLLQALEAAKKLEREIAQSASNNQNQKEKPHKPPPLWYWALRLEQQSSEKLLQAWQASEDCFKASASGIQTKDEHHVTLLYLGGGKDEEVAARNPRLSGPEHVSKLKEEFKQRQGEAITLEVRKILWEDGRIAAAAVVLPDHLRQLCANEYPHITIGLASRVNAVVSNELLARRAATEDLQQGLQAWLQQLSLGQYAPQLACWCQNMGAASPEELAEFALDAAKAVEADEESQERIAEVLQKAVQRPIHELLLDRPLQLTSLLQGVPKGQ